MTSDLPPAELIPGITDDQPRSSLTVFTDHMGYLVQAQGYSTQGYLMIEHVTVTFPATWGSGEGMILYLRDDHGSLNQLNLQSHHLDVIRQALSGEAARNG